MRHPDALERRLYALPPVGGRHAAIREGQLHVLRHREIPDQVEGLKDEPDLAVADARAIGGRQGVNRFPGQFVPAAGWGSSRPRIESSVVLPQPDGPPIATYSPSRISR